MNDPDSLLTKMRPDIWRRSLELATSLTGYTYAPKLPLSGGAIYACGGGGVYVPPPSPKPSPKPAPTLPDEQPSPTPQNPVPKPLTHREEDELLDITNRLRTWRSSYWPLYREELERRRDELLRKKLGHDVVFVPEGAADWLLHEVGHWIAATVEERTLQNYGLGEDESVGANREWEAWAFQEIILSPFGHARDLTPPTYRCGVGYSRNGPLPQESLRHIERQMRLLNIDVEPWRLAWGDWYRWGNSIGHRAPWRSEQ